MNEFISGAEIDTRTEAEKAKDWQFREVVASADLVNWQQKPQDQWRRFPIFNQDGSGSCVAQTEAKELGIMRQLKDGNYVHFSATHIYQRRSNKPYGGMAAIDARKIVTEGVTLETLSPGQNINDNQMDSLTIEPYKQEVGKVFKVQNYLADPIKDIETVASIIQKTQKGVMVWFYFEYSEWTERPTVLNPNLDLNAPATVRHSVTAVDFTLLPDGKKAIVIEDSWGPDAGIGGQRTIDEDFFIARNWYAGHLVNFQFDEPQPTKPQHVFLTDLEFGMTGPEVVALQDCLKWEGTFPSNAQSTGYYGSVTKTAVQAFQVKHGIASPTSLGYGRTGPKTRAKLNEIFG